MASEDPIITPINDVELLSPPSDHNERSPSFKYSPLAPGEIRLLTIKFDTVVDGTYYLEFDLSHSQMEQAEYCALSYTWGDQTQKIGILVNGCEIKVGPNLADALKFFGHAPNGKPLWIDSICINQNDLDEKSQQVRQMEKIYSQSSLVVIHLGPAADDSDFALAKLQQLDELARSSDAPLGNSISKWINAFTSEQIFGTEFDKTTMDRSWVALSKLFRRAYWFRIWILQEASTTGPRTYACGKYEIPMSWMINAAKILGILPYREQKVTFLADVSPVGLDRVAEFEERRERAGPVRLQLLSLLSTGRRSEATDPRDKVYAMLNFASDLRHGEIVPDYRKPVAQLYTEVALWALHKHNNLDILGYCSNSFHFSQRITEIDHFHRRPWNLFGYSIKRSDTPLLKKAGNELGLPSWVPDWCDKTDQNPFIKVVSVDYKDHTYKEYKRCYNATGFVGDSTYNEGPPCYRVNGRPDSLATLTLTVSGLYLGKVNKVKQICDTYSDDATELFCCPFLYTQFQHFLYPRDKNSVAGPLHKALIASIYLRTLVADMGIRASNNVRGGHHVFKELAHLEAEEHDFSSTIQMKRHTMLRRIFYFGSLLREDMKPANWLHKWIRWWQRRWAGASMIGHKASLMGLGPHNACVDDEIFALKGGSVLYMLRPLPNEVLPVNDELNPATENQQAAVNPIWVTSLTSLDEKNRVVRSAVCNGCDKLTYGVRHSCISHANYDLCGECIFKADQIHPGCTFVALYERFSNLSGAEKPMRRFKFVGECYVDGMMDGEVLKMLRRVRAGSKHRVLKDMDDQFRDILLV